MSEENRQKLSEMIEKEKEKVIAKRKLVDDGMSQVFEWFDQNKDEFKNLSLDEFSKKYPVSLDWIGKKFDLKYNFWNFPQRGSFMVHECKNDGDKIEIISQLETEFAKQEDWIIKDVKIYFGDKSFIIHVPYRDFNVIHSLFSNSSSLVINLAEEIDIWVKKLYDLVFW